MTDGKRVSILFPDDRKLELTFQPGLLTGDLLDLVASHASVKEKEYFGLAYLDDRCHHLWLQLDRKVLDHDFLKKIVVIPVTNSSKPLSLHFLIKLYLENITLLRESSTVEQFFHQVRSCIAKGRFDLDRETAFTLAGWALQASYGDFIDSESARLSLKKLSLLPSGILKEHSHTGYCEERILEAWKGLNGYNRGQAIVNYLSIAEALPNYGVHFYEVKDKRNVTWWLGVSFKGIGQYDHADRKRPRRIFHWKQLENLYFRDKKFSIEVHDAKKVVHTVDTSNVYSDEIRTDLDKSADSLAEAISEESSQVSVSRRTVQPGSISVYVWFCANQTLTKTLWQMAICQHQFYLDRKHSKAQQLTVRPLTDIVADLSKSVTSLSTASSHSSLSRGGSSSSLKGGMAEIEESESERAARMEMLSALKARKDSLEDKLKEKLEKLKELCLKEAEITGELPPETPLSPGEPIPQVRRRIGTAFTLPESLITRAKSKEDEAISSLELQVELVKKITAAALRLSEESSARRTVRRQRKQMYLQSVAKLNSLEIKLRELKMCKLTLSKDEYNNARRKKPRPVSDDEGGFLRQAQLLADKSLSPLPPNSPLLRRMPPFPTSQQRSGVDLKEKSLSPTMTRRGGPLSAPASPIKQRSVTSNQGHGSLHSGHQHLRSSQRIPLQQNHPVAYQTVHGSQQQRVPMYALHPPMMGVDPGAGVGAYNVPLQRTSRDFLPSESLDDLEMAGMKRLVSPRVDHLQYALPSSLQSPNTTGSLDVSWDFGTESPKAQGIFSDSQSHNQLLPPNGILRHPHYTDPFGLAQIQRAPSAPHVDTYWTDSRTSLAQLPPTPSYSIPPVDVVDSATIGPRYRSREQVPRSSSNQEGLNHIHNISFASSGGSFELKESNVSHARSFSTVSERSDHYSNSGNCAYVKSENVSSHSRLETLFGVDHAVVTKEKQWYESSVDSPVASRKKLGKTQSCEPSVSAVNYQVPGENLSAQFATINVIDRVADRRLTESVVPFESPKNQTVIQPGTIQPYREVSKPFEMSDFYKYSTKFKKQVSSVGLDEIQRGIYQSATSLAGQPMKRQDMSVSYR